MRGGRIRDVHVKDLDEEQAHLGADAPGQVERILKRFFAAGREVARNEDFF